MLVAVVVLAVLVALLALFVVALLRSHAEILRRLASLEGVIPEPAGAAGARSTGAPSTGTSSTGARSTGAPSVARGGPAADIAGETLAGDAVKLSLGTGSPPALLAFLSSTCTACGPLWQELGGAGAQAGVRVVAVTKGPERERLARLQALAPAGCEVVMSTAAFADYEVPATPHFVRVSGGIVAGRGSATSWEQIGGFMRDAEDDGAALQARSTSDRALRAEQALAGAGITPDHPSLYPTRTGERTGRTGEGAGE